MEQVSQPGTAPRHSTRAREAYYRARDAQATIRPPLDGLKRLEQLAIASYVSAAVMIDQGLARALLVPALDQDDSGRHKADQAWPSLMSWLSRLLVLRCSDSTIASPMTTEAGMASHAAPRTTAPSGGVGDDDACVPADPKDGVEPWHEQTGHENDRQGHRQRAPAGNRCVLAVVSAAAYQTVPAKDDQPAGEEAEAKAQPLPTCGS